MIESLQQKDWFDHWFNESYLKLYSHRNDRQANYQVHALVQFLQLPNTSYVLDVGCGYGRHLEVFSHLNFNYIYGIDKSETLLKMASSHIKEKLLLADMRQIPFKNNSFELVTSFFSSFGYFSTDKENFLMFAELLNRVKKGGFLFLDLANKNPVINNIIANTQKTIDGILVDEKRYLKGNVVVKDIVFHSDTQKRYQERLRLYSPSEIEGYCNQLGASVVAIWGDEKGRSYHINSSTRMSFIIKK